MSEGMNMSMGSVSAPSAPAPAAPQVAPMEGGFERGDIFEAPAPHKADEIVYEGSIVEHTEEISQKDKEIVSGDDVLEYVKENGIEEGFEYVARGFTSDQKKEENTPKEPLYQEAEIPEQIPQEKIPQEKDWKEEFMTLKEEVHTLTEGNEELRQRLNEVMGNFGKSIEINYNTIKILYEIIQQLYEDEEDKKRKNSLLMLLVKLTGYLITALMAGHEEGVKAVKDVQPESKQKEQAFLKEKQKQAELESVKV